MWRCKKLRDEDEGTMGVGTMIIFIGMVLVAAVAAGLLIDVAAMVQQQAQETGTRAIQDVAGGMKVMNLLGDRHFRGFTSDWYNASVPGASVGAGDANNTTSMKDTIEILEIKVRLQSGSPSLYMGEVIIEITDGESESDLSFYDVNSDYANQTNATRFTVEGIRDPDGSWANSRFIADGTLVKIYIGCNRTGMNLTIQTHVAIKMIPKHGSYTYETFYTPDSYGTRRYVELF